MSVAASARAQRPPRTLAPTLIPPCLRCLDAAQVLHPPTSLNAQLFLGGWPQTNRRPLQLQPASRSRTRAYTWRSGGGGLDAGGGLQGLGAVGALPGELGLLA